jgi:hypothetical protein
MLLRLPVDLRDPELCIRAGQVHAKVIEPQFAVSHLDAVRQESEIRFLHFEKSVYKILVKYRFILVQKFARVLE